MRLPCLSPRRGVSGVAPGADVNQLRPREALTWGPSWPGEGLFGASVGLGEPPKPDGRLQRGKEAPGRPGRRGAGLAAAVGTAALESSHQQAGVGGCGHLQTWAQQLCTSGSH